MTAPCQLLLAALGAAALVASLPVVADDSATNASEATPRTSVSIASKRRREAQLQAEHAWRELVERVPDLGTLGLRPQARTPQRVPRASEVATRRRFCQQERDPNTNKLVRRCYSYLDPNP